MPRRRSGDGSRAPLHKQLRLAPPPPKLPQAGRAHPPSKGPSSTPTPRAGAGQGRLGLSAVRLASPPTPGSDTGAVAAPTPTDPQPRPPLRPPQLRSPTAGAPASRWHRLLGFSGCSELPCLRCFSSLLRSGRPSRPKRWRDCWLEGAGHSPGLMLFPFLAALPSRSLLPRLGWASPNSHHWPSLPMWPALCQPPGTQALGLWRGQPKKGPRHQLSTIWQMVPQSHTWQPSPWDLGAHQSWLWHLPPASSLHCLCQAGLFSGKHTRGHSCNLPASGMSQSLQVPSARSALTIPLANLCPVSRPPCTHKPGDSGSPSQSLCPLCA